MNDAKSFLLSKTIWGVVITLFGVVMSNFGWTPFDEVTSQELAGQVVSVLGGILAVAGRVKASRPLKVK